jgi:acyl-CoA hydrolase
MSCSESYTQKVTTPSRAVEMIRSGDRVYIHIACAAPTVLLEALVGCGDSRQNVEIVDLVALYKSDFGGERRAGHFRHHALFIGAGCREAVVAGRADYTPVFLSEVERLFTSGALPLDVALLQRSPPDVDGNMSLDIGVDTSLTAADSAGLVIAEVNRQMPRTVGESSIHVSKVAAIVQTDHALIEVPSAPLTEVKRRIGVHVAALIPNGATLQIGIGGIPDAVLGCQRDHHDLGIHTEMVSDGMVPLVEAGVIRGARKTLHPGKAVAGFALGTQGMFRFLDENSMFEFHPVSYTHDPFVIARNENIVAVNSAIQVDVTGPVSSDSIGTRYRGCGGQVDFMRLDRGAGAVTTRRRRLRGDRIRRGLSAWQESATAGGGVNCDRPRQVL